MSLQPEAADVIPAPWDMEIVEALNAYQHGGGFHGYTCAAHPRNLLTAHPDGWRCSECAYRQTWASRDAVTVGQKVLANDWPAPFGTAGEP